MILECSNLELSKRQTVHRQQDTELGELTEQGNLYRYDKGNVQAENPQGKILEDLYRGGLSCSSDDNLWKQEGAKDLARLVLY